MKKFLDLSSWSRKAAIGSMLVVAFAVVGCDDSSSASAGQNEEPGVESSSSSSGKVTEPAEVTSSSSEKAKQSNSSSSVDPVSSSNLQGDKKSSSSGKNEISSSSVKSESTEKSSSSEKSSETSSSSADEVKSSSSVSDVPQSYAEAKVMPSGTYDCSKYSCFTTEYLNQEFLEAGKYGEILDERDGQVYKTVQIGEQVWIAQNLNFETEISWCGGGSDTAEGDCATYGRLYTWTAAIDSVKLANDVKNPLDCGHGKTCTLPDTVCGICPPGWHLPTDTEWENLFTAVGGQSTAGKALKSQTGWYNNRNGTDAFGFSALPAGDSDNDNEVSEGGTNADFWSSTEYGSNSAYDMYLYYGYERASLDYLHKSHGFSVRCVKD